MSGAPARVLAPPVERAHVEGEPAPRARPLTLVPRSRVPAARTPFVLVVVALLVGWLLTLLALNTALAQMSFHAYDLSQDNRDLMVREQTLRQQVQDRTSPAALAAAAAAQGMVPGQQPAFLDLATGTVLGSASQAQAPVPSDPQGAGTGSSETDGTDAAEPDADAADLDAPDPDVSDPDVSDPDAPSDGTDR